MRENGEGNLLLEQSSPRMQADREAGMSVRQISEKYGCSRKLVYQKTETPVASKMARVPHSAGLKTASEKRHDAGKQGPAGQKPGSPCSNGTLRTTAGDLPEMPEMGPRVCAHTKCKRRELGHTFQPKRVAQIYCSPQCRKAAWLDRHYILRKPVE